MSKVCIVVPCYNEAARLNLDAFATFLKAHPNYHFLFVNDGSTDDTLEVLTAFAKNQSQAMVVDLTINGGKAEAVRKGMLKASRDQTYEFIGFIDADLATPLTELPSFLETMQNNPEALLSLGSRWKRLGARIDRKIMRHYLGRIFATVTSILFQFDIYDTQCGAKLMRNVHVDHIFSDPFISSWFFDIEILCRLQNLQGSKPVDEWAIEIPLKTWREVGGSRIKIWDFITAPLALLKIRRHYRK